MTRPPRLARGLAACLAVLLLSPLACLPEDDTPEPGVASFVVRGDPGSAQLPPFEDGWTVTITRARLLGSRSFQTDAFCDVYSESDLSPTLVNPLAEGDAALGRVRGLGPCQSAISPGGTLSYARLGPGVTEDDRSALLATLGESGELGSGLGLTLEARAERAGEVVTVSLLVPAQGLYLLCPRANGDAGYTLRSGEQTTLVVTYDLSRVFADGPRPGGRLRFEPFLRADAEGNRDGHVTPGELGAVELSRFAQLGYDLTSFGSLRPLTPTLTHWVVAMATEGYQLDGRDCQASGFPNLGGLEEGR